MKRQAKPTARAAAYRHERSTRERIGHFIVMVAVVIFLLHTIIQHFWLHH